MYDGKLSPESAAEIKSFIDDMMAQYHSGVETFEPFLGTEYDTNARAQIMYCKHAIAACRELRYKVDQRTRKEG